MGQSCRLERYVSRPLDPEERTNPAARRSSAFPNVTRALRVSGEAQELLLHCGDLGEICRDIVIATALAGGQMESAARKSLGWTCAAEMNYGSEFLLVLRAHPRVWTTREKRRNFAV